MTKPCGRPRGPPRALNREETAALIHRYFRMRQKQVTLAIAFRVSQSTVHRYITRAEL